MRRFFDIVLRVLLVPLIFLGVLGACKAFTAHTTVSLTAYLQTADDVSLTYYDGKYATVAPQDVKKDVGSQYLLTFKIPSGADGRYTFSFGDGNTSVKISEINISQGIYLRHVGATELAVEFTSAENTDGASLNSVNKTFLVTGSEGGISISNPSAIRGRYISVAALAVIAAISLILALLIAPMILSRKEGKGGRVLRIVGICVAAVFVIGAVLGGAPTFGINNSAFDDAAEEKYREQNFEASQGESLKEQLEKIEAEKEEQALAEKEQQLKDDAAANVYDDTVVYPMMTDSGTDKDDQNKPKVSETQLKKEGFSYNNVHVGKTDENGVTWYFYGDEKSEFNGYNLANDRDLNRMVKSFTEYADLLAQLDIEFYIVICPNKSTVYPEYVPSNKDWYHSEYTKLDQVYDHLAANTDLNLIDLRDALETAKEVDFPLYYEYDTHWNNYGGFAAYGEIMRVISEKFPLVRIRQREDYQITLMESYMKDQLWYLGYYNKFESIGPVFTPLEPSGTTLADIEPNKIAGIFQYQFVYPDGFYDWNKFSKFINPALDDAGAPSVYVLRDSFGISLTYFMRESFSKSVFSLTNGGLPSVSTIQREDPDIVIYEIAERNINAMFSQ